ncbi:MAG: J domain-containing protein [Proteobacteria bacterium]|nr:J domain-containing protein [Pseudomonadota bacterium]
MQIAQVKQKTKRPPEDAVVRIRRLLRRKRSEKNRLELDIDALQRELLTILQRQSELVTIHAEIRALFAEAIALPRLSAKASRKVRDLYHGLMEEGLIIPDPEAFAGDEDECPCPFCEAEPDADALDGAEDPETSWSAPGSDATDESSDADGHARHSGRPSRLERDAGLRRLYRDLALRFHPDRAEDKEQLARHESVMREVNDAYHGGDTDRLLELCRELGLEMEELRSTDGVLAELVEQYERLKEEVRSLRYTPPGQLVVDTRRAKRHGHTTPIEELESEVREQLDGAVRMREFVREFVEGRITLEELLEGPRRDGDGDNEDDYEDDFSALMALLVEEIGRERSSAPTTAGKRRKNGKKRTRNGNRKKRGGRK